MTEDKDSIKEIIRKEYPYLKNHFSIKRIGLFGSFATETTQKNSDVDLLVEFTAPIGFKFMALAEYLENKLGRKVDILTPDGLKTIRIKQVVEKIKKSLIYV